MEFELITCGGCKESCTDPKVFVCGFYCDECVDKLLKKLDANSNELKCFFCKDLHKILVKGFKSYSSMVNLEAAKLKVCLDGVYRGKSVQELNVHLKVINSAIDTMGHDLSNPIEIIK